MSPGVIQQELEQVSQKINRWQAEWRGAFAAAGVLAVLALCAGADLLFRFSRHGRMVLWGILLVALLAAIILLMITLRRRRTAESTAALLEHAFPQLDNHLINYVQFASSSTHSSLESAYLRHGVPEWKSVDLRALRDKRAYLKSYIACGSAILLVLVPCFAVGEAWTRALRRVINPFSSLAPKTVATLVAVLPGNATVVQGEELILSCKAKGRKGQPVELSLWPSDDKSSTALLGTLAGSGGEEEFVFRIAKVAAPLDYRFTAGDAPASDRFSIIVRPPLAFTSLRFSIAPPDYTALPKADADALSSTVSIPQGAQIDVRMQCNQALANADLFLESDPSRAMTLGPDQSTWLGRFIVTSGRVIRVSARDKASAEVKSEIKFILIPDKAPAIQVIAPTAKTVLRPGAAPRIQCEITDDYGLSRVAIMRVPRGDKESPGKPVQEWPLRGERRFSGDWVGKTDDADMESAFRLVAWDNRQPGEPNKTVSPFIIFDSVTTEALLDDNKKSAEEALSTLSKLIELQRANLTLTLKLVDTIKTSTAEQWKEIAAAQKVIRRITGDLVANPRKPLGTLTEVVRSCFLGAMNQVIDVVERLPVNEGAERLKLGQKAVELETEILRVLAQAEAGAARVQQHQKVTGLLSLLDAIVKNQQEVGDLTRVVVEKSIALDPALGRRQDKLGSDFAQFVTACKNETQNSENNDKDFSALVSNVVALAESSRIHVDLLTAAEHLDTNKPAEAVPVQARALTNLKQLQAALNAWRIKEAEAQAEMMAEVLERASENMDKLVDVQKKVVESIRQSEHQKNKDDKATDELEEELDELKSEMKEAVLKIANDLQVMPELPVGNDLVEDVSQIYEEMKQEAGSETAAVIEQALQKEDEMLKLLTMAAGRIDDMEMWLTAKPDMLKMNTESYDKAELNKNGAITLMPLPTQMEDVIGELLKQQEDLQKQAEDSAANQGSADTLAGWDIKEGQLANYSGKGKSGNEAPDHKEQDGRSGLGREGLSDGETVAGSGKINEGDKNIEKRRTKDSAASGQVQLEGDTKAKATGGGKEAGASDEKGMAGDGPRRDSTSSKGSEKGMQAMLRRDAETIYAQATLQHIRTGKLDESIRHMRQAEDALVKGLPIKQVREFQKRAIMALKETQAELTGGFSAESVANTAVGDGSEPSDVASVADEAPTRYRDLVSEYFKALGESK